MKKKMKVTRITILLVIIMLIISFFIPFRKSKEWVNDSQIYEIGHEETHYYNIYNILIK